MCFVSDTDGTSLSLPPSFSLGHMGRQKLVVGDNDNANDSTFHRESVSESFYFDLQ